MFVLAELQDTLRIPPQSLSIPLQDAVTQEIASLYFDKVSYYPHLFVVFCFDVHFNLSIASNPS